MNPGPVGQRPFVDLDYMDYEVSLSVNVCVLIQSVRDVLMSGRAVAV